MCRSGRLDPRAVPKLKRKSESIELKKRRGDAFKSNASSFFVRNFNFKEIRRTECAYYYGSKVEPTTRVD